MSRIDSSTPRDLSTLARAGPSEVASPSSARALQSPYSTTHFAALIWAPQRHVKVAPMRKMLESLGTVFLFVSAPVPLAAQRAVSIQPMALNTTTKFALTNGRVLWVDYRGRRALKLAPLEGHERDTDQEIVAVLTESDFKDGVIEVDVAGARREGYASDNVSAFKGFIGVSFRVHGDSAERIYIRPENARLTDQLFRNRSTQYEADPD